VFFARGFRQPELFARFPEGWCYEGWCCEGCYEVWCYEGWCYGGWCYEGLVLRGQHPGVLTGTRKKPAKVCRERVCYEAQKAREGVSEKVPGVPPGTFRERAANSNSGFPAQILSPEFKKPRKLDSKTTKNKNYIQVNNFQAQKAKNTGVILQTSVHSQTFTPPRKRQVIRSYLFHTALGEVGWNAGFGETGG
jgi:hypothetical protein